MDLSSPKSNVVGVRNLREYFAFEEVQKYKEGGPPIGGGGIREAVDFPIIKTDPPLSLVQHTLFFFFSLYSRYRSLNVKENKYYPKLRNSSRDVSLLGT